MPNPTGPPASAGLSRPQRASAGLAGPISVAPAASRGPQGAPRRPKTLPRRPKTAQDGSKTPQEAPKEAPGVGKWRENGRKMEGKMELNID